MKLISRHRNLPTLIEEYNAGRYNLNHPLQRPGGQWILLQQSELIDSVFRDYSIDPVTVVSSMSVNGETKKTGNAVIDGIQRITTFARFINNEFRLSKKLEDEPFIIDDVTYLPSEVLWGKKYDELEDKLKDKLKTFELSIDFYSDATEKEIRELFRRKNSGKPLTNAQKNSVNISDELYGQIKSILNAKGYSVEIEKKNRAGEIMLHDGKPVMSEKKVPNLWNRIFSVGIFKNSEDRNIILEIMMLISGYDKEHEFGFRSEDIQEFITWFNEQDSKTKQDTIDQIIKAADSIDHRITEKIPNLKKTSIPMVVAGMCKVIKSKGGKDKYMDQIYKFFNSYEENLEYRDLCGSGSASKENVQARWEVFKNIAKKS